MDSARIHGPTLPTQGVQAAHDSTSRGRDEETPEFQLEDAEERRPEPKQEREHGEFAPREDDESGGHLDVTA